MHQHLVIVAVKGRHLLDAGQLGGEPARLLDGGHRAGRLLPRRPAGGLPVRIKVFQHGAVGADQLLQRLPLPQPDLFQLGPGLLEDGRYPLAQHLGQVVAGPHPRGVHQARHQRQPLGLLIPRQRVDVLGSRLPGEVSDLARRDPLQPRRGVPSSSTRSRYPAWALNRDQVARWAGFFSRSNIDLPSSPAVVSSPPSRCRPSGPIRDTMPAKIPALTSARMAAASSSSVENAGSSSEASTSRSSATLIRSGGWFFTSAASRIAAAARARARRWS